MSSTCSSSMPVSSPPPHRLSPCRIGCPRPRTRKGPEMQPYPSFKYRSSQQLPPVWTMQFTMQLFSFTLRPNLQQSGTALYAKPQTVATLMINHGFNEAPYDYVQKAIDPEQYFRYPSFLNRQASMEVTSNRSSEADRTVLNASVSRRRSICSHHTAMSYFRDDMHTRQQGSPGDVCGSCRRCERRVKDFDGLP